MGGFGALRNGLKYHDTFGAVICLSGALHVLENPEESRADSFAHEEGYFGNLVEAAKSDKNPAVLIEQLKEARKKRSVCQCADRIPGVRNRGRTSGSKPSLP